MTVVACVGFGFQDPIRLVAPLARPDQRAGVLSSLHDLYLVLGIPADAARFAIAKEEGS
jgi:hypothetical protein